ncbi:transposon Ty3-I Gag-Pol polyprotein [Trichonephila clavipes]|nr:transposon Ty3-I Gag-Pol polyprotein [Trichonephila clavipes]
MQVYEAEVEDEIVVQHVTNSQIRRELFELISNYEPKKTEMTNVSMIIILKRRHTAGRTTELHTDASQQGYGAVFTQEAEDGKLHPVNICRRKRLQRKEKYSSYELEVLAVINAFEISHLPSGENHLKS